MRHAPALLAAALALVATTPAAAQDGEAPLLVLVRDASSLDPEALAQGLEADLGRPVVLASPEAEEGAAVIIDSTKDGVIHLEVRRAGLEALERDTPITDRAQTTLSVSLLVANLVRDESVEVLAMIQADGSRATAGVEEPAPEAVEEPAPAEPNEPAPAEPPAPTRIAAGVDLFPLVGVSSAYLGTERRHLSLGAVGALSGGVDGLALSGVVDLSLGSVHGIQLAGVHAQSGDLEGLQIGGVSAIALGAAQGVQLGGIAAIATGPMEGLQLAPVNVTAAEVVGAQIGLFNIGGRVHGLQLGLFNVAEEADASVGLFSVQRRGSNHLRAEIDSNGFFSVAFVNRGAVTYAIVSAGIEPFIEKPTGSFGVGFGARATLTDALYLDFEALAHILFDRELAQEGPSSLYDARILFGARITPQLLAYLGIGIRTHLEVGTRSGLGAPIMIHDEPTAGSPRARVWPTITGGVELF